MELRDLDYFTVVAQHGHLGRAAESLKLTTSALSKCLRRLEKTLQVKLVTRTVRGVALTAEGESLLARSNQMRICLSDISREIQEMGHGHIGHVRVGAIAGIEDSVLTKASIAFLRSAQRIRITVTLGNSEVLVPALRNGELDIIVTAVPSNPYDDITQEVLLNDDFVACASPNHRLGRRRRLTLADLQHERWAVTSANNQIWEQFHRMFESRGLAPPDIAMVAVPVSLRLHTISATNILGFISFRLLREVSAEIPLIALPINESLYQRCLAVGYRKSGYLSPAAKRYLDFLRQASCDLMLPNHDNRIKHPQGG